MSVKIVVPALGESVSEATIAKWHKKPGDFVKIDDLLVELETEKVTLEVSSPSNGVLETITHKEGDVVAVGDEVGSIKEGAAPAVEKSVKPQENSSSNEQAHFNSGLKSQILSPSAQKISTEKNLDISLISGTGKDGRITKGDVINYNPNNVSAGSSNIVTSENSRIEERVKMSRLRKTIAQRLKDSQNTAAILTTFNEIDMSNIMAIRKKYQEEFTKKHGIKLGFMSFFVKAAVNALIDLPAVNARIEVDDIIYHKYCDIGVAVGTEQGLVVPVIKNSEKMGFADIEKTIADFGARARSGKLSMSELTGGTFSITNGGVYGSLMSTPIINPPQSAILGMHKTMDRPVVVDGKIEIRPMMYIALSYDHRIIDGKEAVTFLVKVKDACENPERLLFDL